MNNLFATSELNLNTQAGTPVELAVALKYLFQVQNPNITPYLDGGLDLWFVTGGPFFGVRVGGGSYFKIGTNLQVPDDLQLGPIFSSGSTKFSFALTSGIRYILP